MLAMSAIRSRRHSAGQQSMVVLTLVLLVLIIA
jgi:hypothetical protein